MTGQTSSGADGLSADPADPDALAAAQDGDTEAFERLVTPHRRELQVHCYRMLGSVADAEDATQETLVAAWRGIAGFEQRSSLRAWLYRIATNYCLRQLKRRPPRLLSWDHGPARSTFDDLGTPVAGPVWLEPWPGDIPADGPEQSDPAAAYDRRESVELAYVAALQHLPATQRAVLILREVLAFSAAETAAALDPTVASVNSALQRARKTLAERGPRRSQQAEWAALPPDGPSSRRGLIDAFVAAWERSDIPAIVDLLTEDARFTMPPLPAWFDGRGDIAGFMSERMFATPWRLTPITVNAQPGFGCYYQDGEDFRLGAVNILSLWDGRVAWIAAFVDPEVTARFGLPATYPSGG
jgi:RNA polymerase sigma-70 factor (TIGR02960 family)